MKKIMFDDKYGLTEAVLTGRKTMTRRIISESALSRFGHNKHSDKSDELIRFEAAYKVGEIVAVAQSYENVYKENRDFLTNEIADEKSISDLKSEMGWRNKMNVKPAYMPHQIKIIAVKVERLKDIEPREGLKEGVTQVVFDDIDMFAPFKGCKDDDLRYCVDNAFEILIDKVSGKGTWQRNPWVFAYEFKLVK